jgi:AAA family ATP:ADP antiporter
MSICLPMFGMFGQEEFKKFLRMGLVFGLIVGAYWSLGALKQATICTILGPACVPKARIFSMFGMLALLMVYTKLLDRYAREKVFYFICWAYGAGVVIFAWLFAQGVKTQAFAYMFALFCDTYGSLIIALFWSIATDTTLPDSAKKGFPFIVALGQIGGIVLPLITTSVHKLLPYEALTVAMMACLVPILGAWIAMQRFLSVTPAELLMGFHGVNEDQYKQQQKPTFFEGLRTLRSHVYVAAIAVVCIVPDFLAVLFDMHFLVLVHQHYAQSALTQYLGMYGASINGLTLLFLLCGISNITRYVGMASALVLVPLMFLGALISFAVSDQLQVLFAIMVYTKAVTYAFSVPLIKQLYIPTTHDVRFKAQAWIDGFGLQSSKVTASMYNMLLVPLQRWAGESMGRVYHVLISTSIGFLLILIWLPIAYYLGKQFMQAVKQNKVVC